MKHKYSISVLDIVIEFEDDIDTLSIITPFKVVMDAIPVFYAYKIYKDTGILDAERKEAEQISSNCNALSVLYDELREEIRNLRKEISSLWEKYEEWLRDCWAYLEGGEWNNDDQLDNVDWYLRHKLEEHHIQIDEYGIVAENIERFLQSVRKSKRGLARNLLKDRFLYWLVGKVEKSILQAKSFFALDIFLKRKGRNGPSSRLSQHTLFFSLDGQKDVLIESVDFACMEFGKMASSIPGDRFITELDSFFKKEGNRESRKKYGGGTGCFAIMTNLSGQFYYALSGLQRKEAEYDDVCKKIEATLFSKLNPIRCKVSPKMLYYDWTYREEYPAYAYKSWTFQGKRFVGDDKYTCCERKILAHNAVRDDNIFFIRWAPCVRCRPVLFNRYRKIYAFAESSKYKSVYCSTQLDEYSIGICFGFECKKV